ncbi:MAG: citrate (Si)-synthase [Nitrospinota bacterium]|nr:MAG: citrate (Si)-synthase [Nitrospinota bacterium]
MATLKEKLSQIIPPLREEIRHLIQEYGKEVISEVTVAQAYGGMRGVKALVCDTSQVDNNRGLFIRGRHISELTGKRPEEILYLLLTGEFPDADALNDLTSELQRRATVPEYVWDVLRAMPPDSHPMTMFSAAILVLEKESIFKQQYHAGLKKEDFWIPTLEDALNLVARVPVLAAGIYRLRYQKGEIIPPDPQRDLGANLAHMMGVPDPNGEFANLMRLYLVIYCDHENGNVSAMTTHTVASALSNLYLAVSAGMNGLAGPLHGLAMEECLRWILMVKEKFGGVPTDEALHKFAWETLESGQVIPGYGHAVLRQTDPRFLAILEFGRRVCPEDEVFQLVEKTFKVVPPILIEQGKAKDPWPNVDAASGSLLWHFGVRELEYYTVLFGVARTLGVCSQAVISRAIGSPIVRPKSVTTQWIRETVTKKTAAV